MLGGGYCQKDVCCAATFVVETARVEASSLPSTMGRRWKRRYAKQRIVTKARGLCPLSRTVEMMAHTKTGSQQEKKKKRRRDEYGWMEEGGTWDIEGICASVPTGKSPRAPWMMTA